MVRGGIVLLVLGAVLGYYATQEMRVSSGSQSEPLAVDLAKLEAGETPSSNYVRVGEHWAICPAAVYRWKPSKYDTKKEATSSTSIEYCYYPIVTKSHPSIPVIERAMNQQIDGPLDLGTFRVLVKSKRYATVGSIPGKLVMQSSMDGLIVNRISSLDADEATWVKKGFPKLNVDKVLILEEGRKPTSIWAGMAMMLGALALAGGGVGLFVVHHRKRKAATYDGIPTLG
jgi:hypothetical protein